jgi:N utilization substance protein B
VSPARPSRKQARRDALLLLYQREVTTRPLTELVDGHRLREGYPPDDFTLAVVGGVMKRQDELDAELGAHSTNWALERLAPLERSVLRLALYEFDSGLTPPEVAIDEAVRLARRYSTDEAGALVNGILGAVARERRGSAHDEDAADDEAQAACGETVTADDAGRDEGDSERD